jgi:hypothetical protein
MKFSHDIKTIRSVTSHLDNYQIKASTPQEKNLATAAIVLGSLAKQNWQHRYSDRFNICFLYFLKTSETSLSKLTAASAYDFR